MKVLFRRDAILGQSRIQAVNHHIAIHESLIGHTTRPD